MKFRFKHPHEMQIRTPTEVLRAICEEIPTGIYGAAKLLKALFLLATVPIIWPAAYVTGLILHRAQGFPPNKKGINNQPTEGIGDE